MTDYAITQIEVDGKEKFSISYALTDENGQPLLDRSGKPRMTNLIGDTQEEVIGKIVNANLEVARALERSNRHIETLKNRKPTPKQPQTDLKAKPLSQEETIQVGLDIQDPRKAAAAVEKVLESRIGPVAGEVERQRQTLDATARLEVARRFFGRHPEYNLSANGAMLAKWLHENNFEFTEDNIEIAFATLQDQLAIKQALRNEPPVTVAPVEPESGNAAPGNEHPNPGNPPPQPRRAPVGGIRDSQATARPGASVVLTRQQALDMLYKDRPKYEAWMRDPEKNAILTRALAGR